MDTTQSTVITGGTVKVSDRLQPNKSTVSGIMRTCFDCQYSCVNDMNNEDILFCKQSNSYVTIDTPICSMFNKERWVQE